MKSLEEILKEWGCDNEDQFKDRLKYMCIDYATVNAGFLVDLIEWILLGKQKIIQEGWNRESSLEILIFAYQSLQKYPKNKNIKAWAKDIIKERSKVLEKNNFLNWDTLLKEIKEEKT